MVTTRGKGCQGGVPRALKRGAAGAVSNPPPAVFIRVPVSPSYFSTMPTTREPSASIALRTYSEL